MSRLTRRDFATSLLAAAGCAPVAALVITPAARAAAAPEKKHRATFEVYKDKAGEYRWRLRSTNKQLLASSGEGYKEKRDCIAAIESVKKAATDAPVEEQPETPAS